MLAIASTGASGRHPVDVRKLVETGDWILDAKLDGVRAWLMPDGRILNRKGVDVTYKFPDVVTPASEIVDGEIVAADGTFETTLIRESQENRSTIRRLAESSPCHFVAFDLPERDDPYSERRRRLVADAGPALMAITPMGYDADFIAKVQEVGLEGVIAKRLASKYQYGKRSADWVKHVFTKRVSCIAFGYSPGHGSRVHFGAMHLALLQDGLPVPVGRTGSGFTERQTHDLKARLDAGDYFVAEVEYRNLTSGKQLRFPTFRGIRTDVDIENCTYDQLEG